MEYKEICLKQGNVLFLHKKAVNVIYLSSKFCIELDMLPRDLNTNFALGNCLFKTVKNDDPDKYKYSGYEMG